MRFHSTPGWGPLLVVVGGRSPILAEGRGCGSPPLLAGVRWLWWLVVPRQSWLRAPGAVLRHSWLVSTCGGGVAAGVGLGCVVCVCGVWCVCSCGVACVSVWVLAAVPHHSWPGMPFVFVVCGLRSSVLWFWACCLSSLLWRVRCMCLRGVGPSAPVLCACFGVLCCGWCFLLFPVALVCVCVCVCVCCDSPCVGVGVFGCVCGVWYQVCGFLGMSYLFWFELSAAMVTINGTKQSPVNV